MYQHFTTCELLVREQQIDDRRWARASALSLPKTILNGWKVDVQMFDHVSAQFFLHDRLRELQRAAEHAHFVNRAMARTSARPQEGILAHLARILLRHGRRRGVAISPTAQQGFGA